MPEYRITKLAGPVVAGRANTGAGTTMFLTPREAAHDLRVGAIEAASKAAPAPLAAPKKKGGASE
jgi:hypothetical protein